MRNYKKVKKMHGFFLKAYFEIEPQSDISYFLVEKLGNLWKKVDKMSPVFVCKISNINLYPNHVLKQYSKTKHKQYSEFKNLPHVKWKLGSTLKIQHRDGGERVLSVKKWDLLLLTSFE